MWRLGVAVLAVVALVGCSGGDVAPVASESPVVDSVESAGPTGKGALGTLVEEQQAKLVCASLELGDEVGALGDAASGDAGEEMAEAALEGVGAVRALCDGLE